MTSTEQVGDTVTEPRLPGVAVLAGGGQGIGHAIARRLASEGYDLAVLDIDPRVADSVWSLADEFGVATRFFRCDIGVSALVAKIVADLTSDVGEPSVLVHSAGWTPYGRFLQTSEADEQRILDVNFRSGMSLCRHIVPGMLERGYGRIVVVSSDAARTGVVGEAVYSGAKAGLVAFAKALAAEVAGDGVTVNVVSPGSTDSPMLSSLLSEEQIERRRRANPMRRLARPEEIAGAVAFFVNGDSSYITGQVLSVNGGLLRVG